MGRLTDTVLLGKGHMTGRDAPGVNVVVGGQEGFSPSYRGITANAGYVQKNLIAVLLEAPRGFNDLPDPNVWIDTLKALVETEALTIEGLTSTLTVNYAESPVGGAGEFQEDVVNVVRGRSVPVFSWPEKYGKVINAFFDGWIVNLLGDPDTKVPRVMALAPVEPGDLLPDYTGMTVLFIEPDPTHRKVISAWLSTNMMPKTGGENTGRKERSADGATIVHSIEFTAITQTGDAVREVAQTYLDNLRIDGFTTDNLPAFVEQVSADVDRGDNGGFAQHVNTIANAAG